jgi:hypothetical protein
MAKQTFARGGRSRLPPGRGAETNSRKLQLGDAPCPGSKMAKRTWSVEEPPIALPGIAHARVVEAPFRKTNSWPKRMELRLSTISQDELPPRPDGRCADASFRKTKSSL